MKPETYIEHRIVKGRKIGIEYACKGGRKLRVWAVKKPADTEEK